MFNTNQEKISFQPTSTTAISAQFSLQCEQIKDPLQVIEIRRWFGLDFNPELFSGSIIKNFSPIFICGSGRCGSTLARRLAGSHPEIYAGPESELFLPIELNFQDLSKKFSVDITVLEHLYKNSKGRTGFIRDVAMHLLETNDKAVWV